MSTSLQSSEVPIGLPDVTYHYDTQGVKPLAEPYHVADSRATELRHHYGYGGEGFKVAVLDTGVDAHHPFFADRIQGVHSVISGESGEDQHSHGTHVSSTILQIAPGAEIHSIKVLGSGGIGSDRTVYEGMKKAIEIGVHGVNASLGGRMDSALIQRGARELREAGIILFAAAGNDGASTMSVPARYHGVVSVGAVDRNLNLASFSNRSQSRHLTTCGYGVRIHAAVPRHMGSWQAQSGTSMACPFVVGCMAIAGGYILQHTGKVPQKIEDLQFFKPHLKDLGPRGLDEKHGFGFASLPELMQAAADAVKRHNEPKPDPVGDGGAIPVGALKQTWRGEKDGKAGTFTLVFEAD